MIGGEIKGVTHHVDIELLIGEGNGKIEVRVRTPYAYFVKGVGDTLLEAIQDFDTNYIKAKNEAMK